MSYSVVQPPARRRALPTYPLPSQQPARPPVHPLAQAPAQALGFPPGVLVAIVVVVLLVLLLWWVDQKQTAPVRRNTGRQRAKKQSTKEMARNLYKRLEQRGGVHDTTMRSLKQIGRRSSKSAGE